MTSSQLTDSQLSRLKTLFSDAVDMPPGKRKQFVLDATSSDPLLRRELASLLDAHDSSATWFENLQQELILPALGALDTLDDDTKPGQRVSHYELLERIGGGGMGIVFKARDTRLGRLAALKFLPRYHATNPAARGRLVAEAKTASRLDHPNIGTVYEIGEAENGRQFIAMAWYEGETLKSRIQRGKLAPREVAAVGASIASALAAAHKAGIVHRDVKPANVLLTSAGSTKLVDFGIATLVSETDDDRRTMAGTLAYMSPEQTRRETLDARTDIWSLGVTLYEALTGTRPFRGNTEQDLTAAIQSQDLLLDSSHDGLLRILCRCLEKSRDLRYQSAEELESALAKWRESRDGATETSAPRYSRPLLIATLVAAVAASGWTYSRINENNRRDALVASPLHLTVVSDGSKTIGDALRADLGEELSRLPMVSVSSSTPSQFTVAVELVTQAPMTVQLQLTDSKTAQKFSRTYRADSRGNPDLGRVIARDIASWVKLPLSREQSIMLNRPRTRSSEAYLTYLRGRGEELAAAPALAVAVTNAEGTRSAQGYYAQSRSLDPEFGAVRAHLAATHIASAMTFDTTRARLEQARLEAETALRINGVDPEAIWSLASYWALSGNRQKAITELEDGLKVTPNSAKLLVKLGELYRASGRLDDAITTARRALKLDSLNTQALWLLAMTSGRVRRYDDSFQANTTYLSVRPTDYEVRLIRGHSYLRWTGVADTLFGETNKIPADWDNRGMATYGRYVALRVMRKYHDALRMLDQSRVSLSTDGLVYQPRALMRAEIYHDMGDEKNAKRFYEQARAELADSARAHPNDPNILISLALAYAGLDKAREAFATVQKAIDIAPLAKQTPVATAILGSAVEVYARTGEIDRALESIELLMTMPAGREMSIPLLEAWPGFDPVRNTPRYAAIINRFAGLTENSRRPVLAR